MKEIKYDTAEIVDGIKVYLDRHISYFRGLSGFSVTVKLIENNQFQIDCKIELPQLCFDLSPTKNEKQKDIDNLLNEGEEIINNIQRENSSKAN